MDLGRLLQHYEDPRTAHWPLMSNCLHTLVICVFYIFFVQFAGPKFMQKRKPFKLKKLLIFYNLMQVVISCALFYGFCTGGWLTGEYNFQCQPIDYSSKPSTLRMVKVVWWYYFSKFIELAETIFFILRKKHHQVNVLHVFHHGIMPLSGWLAAKYYPSGHGTFPGLLNSFIHIIMYSYYFFSALGPKIRRFLWWKKYLTSLQMVQFVIIMIHTFQLIFIDCNFPKIFVWYMGILAFTFLTLFNNFYQKSYNNRHTNQKNYFSNYVT